MDDSSAKSVPIPCTMLVLVGEQRIPNAIPIRQHPGAIKRVKMVYSGRTSAAARDLMRWLLTQDVEVRDPEDLILTEKVNDFAQQCSVVKSILGSYRPAEIFVNLTGGTKIMSLAAAELARSGGYKTIYVDTESESFWQVHPIPRRDPLNVVFDVADYWELHGQSFSSPDAPSMLEQGAANFLARNFPQLEPLLHRLQALDRRRALSLPTLTRLKVSFSRCAKRQDRCPRVQAPERGIYAGLASLNKTTGLSAWSTRPAFGQVSMTCGGKLR